MFKQLTAGMIILFAPFIIAIVAVSMVIATRSECVIPGTISATCGPTLPEYTYCP